MTSPYNVLWNKKKWLAAIAIIIGILNTEKLDMASYCFHAGNLHESKTHLTLLYRYLEFVLPPEWIKLFQMLHLSF